MEMPSAWKWRAAIICALSMAQCPVAAANDAPANDLMAIDDAFPYLSPMAQIGFEVAQRRPRNTFDAEYDQFVRGFNADKSAKLRSHHATSSDERGYDQPARERKGRGKHRAHARANLKDGKGKKKKCKVEKKLDMTCTICYDPKNDEKSEKCALTPEPKKKNYEYSNDEKYSSKKRHDSHESDEDQSGADSAEASDESKEAEASGEKRSDDDDERNEQTELDHQSAVAQAPQPQPQPQPQQPQTPLPPQPGPYKPVYSSRNQPRYTPFASRAPQVFPAIYNPSPRYFSQPSNGVRYQYGGQRVRLITLPNGVKVLQGSAPTTAHSRHRFAPPAAAGRSQHGAAAAAEEVRPQRDLADDLSANGGARTNWPWNLATPQFVQSISGDWSQCRKVVENQQTCIECLQSDGRKKECMYTNQAKPDKENFFKSYSSSKHYENEQPGPGQTSGTKPKATVSRVVQHKTHAAFSSLVDGNESANDAPVTATATDRTAPTQPIGAAANVVYGIQKPEQYGLFFRTDARFASNDGVREAGQS